MSNSLPIGQYALDEMPRFGLDQYASRFPPPAQELNLEIGGDIENEFSISEQLTTLPRHQQVSDFHCVTTWSTQNVIWQGWRFADIYNALIVPHIPDPQELTTIIFRCEDGFRSCMLLEDLMHPEVMLADSMNHVPLNVAHGCPIRLIAPAHYGYKNAKHICRIEFYKDDSNFRPPALAIMDHPRARVHLEERGRWLPGIIFRWLYRPLVNGTIKKFATALDNHLKP